MKKMMTASKLVEIAIDCEQNGYWGLSRILLEKAVISKKGSEKCKTLLQLGKLEKYYGNFEKAIQIFNTALEITIKEGDINLYNEIFLQRAIAYQYLGKYELAISEFNKLKKEVYNRDLYIYSHVLMQLGILNRILWNLNDALDLLNECLLIKREISKYRDEAATIEQIGIIYERKGDILRAISLFKKSLKIKQFINYKRGIATYYLRMAVALIKLGNYESAQRYLLLSLRYRKYLGDNIGLGSSYYELAKNEYYRNNYIYSKILIKQSLKIRRIINDPRRLSNTLSLYGKVLLKLGKIQQGIRYLKEAIEIQEELNLKVQLLNTISIILDSAPPSIDLKSLKSQYSDIFIRLTSEQKSYLNYNDQFYS